MKIQFKSSNERQLLATSFWIDSVTEEIVYGGSKGSGKSFLGASLIFADALMYPETHYFIARKELNDLRKYTMPTISEVFQKWGLPLDIYAPFNGQDNCYKLKNGSVVFLIACRDEPSDPLFERFGSMQMTRGWIEEAGEISEDAKDNLFLSLGRWKNIEYGLKKKLLMTCNPKKGWLKRNFVDPFKKGILAIQKQFIQAFAADNIDYVGVDYIKTLANIADPIRRARLAEGDWEYDTTIGSMFESEAIGDLWTNTLEAVTDSDRFMTVDVARWGDDKIVFYFWKGFDLYKKAVYRKQDTKVTSQQLKEFAIQERIPYSHIVVDDDGIGGSVTDQCKGVHGFVNNSSPLPNEEARYDYLEKQNFSNLKTQCAWIMAQKVNRHEVKISIENPEGEFIDELEQELSLYRVKHPDIDTQKTALITKEEMKLELSRSPDYGDAFIMRGFFTLKRTFRTLTPAQERAMIKQQIADQMDFDPFSVL